MANILLIDDEDKLRSLLKRIIALEGYKVCDVANIGSARQLLETQAIDIVLCDVKLPDGNGVDFTKEIKDKYPHIEVILLTAYGNIPDGVAAIKNGAFDYIVKGDDNDKIIPLLSTMAGTVNARRQVKRPESQLCRMEGFEAVIGTSPAFISAVKLAQRVAPADTAVLLTGETGTGKEVFARAIHNASRQKSNAFVALNCSGFTKELLESELFGHKAGAFTGAVKDKKGLVDEAKGGTLFLDEIGEMPLDLQPKLLRLLENGTYLRVGDTKESRSDVRIIAATNKSLLLEIDKGHFRSDLYYRIAVFTIELPPLRERTKDIPELAAYFLHTYAAKNNKHIKSVAKDALDILVKNEWKGNVRELKNIIERAVILEDSDIISIDSLPADMQQGALHTNAASSFQLANVEMQHIKKVLKHTNGNKAEAARLLDIGIATLYRKIEEYRLKD